MTRRPKIDLENAADEMAAAQRIIEAGLLKGTIN